MSELQLGLNDYVTNADYHADTTYLSSSSFKMLLKSAKEFEDKYILKKDVPGLSGDFLDDGSLVHGYILEPDRVGEEFAFFPGFRKAGKEFQKFKADNRGKTIISASQKKRCLEYFESYKKQEAAVSLIKGGASEVTATGFLREIPVKVRADYINVEAGYIADVKTTGMGSDQATFIETIAKYQYDLSAALYLDVFEKLHGKPLDFYFIVISKKERSSDVYRLSEKTRDSGHTSLMKAADKYHLCKKTGIWRDVQDLKRESLESDHYEILEV